MKARIIDDMSEKPNIVEFLGKEYDLQLGMYSYAKIEEDIKGGMDGALKTLGKISTILTMFTIMLNEAIIIKNTEKSEQQPLFTVEYVSAKLKREEFPEIMNAIAIALGLSIGEADPEDEELNSELDKALESENLPETKN